MTAVTPVDDATDVPIDTAATASFSEPMAPIAGAASFTVTCAAPCVSPTGTVVLDAAGTGATFTPAANLVPLTLYTATVTGATSVATGLALTGPYVWHFTTEAGPPVPPAAPTVTAVTPVNNTTGVSINTAVAAAFSEPMAPISGAASFTVTCAAPCASPTGAVALNAAGTNATFTTAANLAPLTLNTS